MRYTIMWVYEGKHHYAHANELLSAQMVARAVSGRHSLVVEVWSGGKAVGVYRNGEAS